MATCSSADSVLEAAQLIKANGTKLNTFVNGTEEQTVQLGTGDPTPTLRNMVANAVSVVADAMEESITNDVEANQAAIAALQSDKADKVASATNGHFAGLNASGNLTDSGRSPADISALEDGKADKVSGATSGNFAGLNASGNLVDSGKKPSDITALQTGKANKVSNAVSGNFAALNSSGDITDSGMSPSNINALISQKTDKVLNAENGNFAAFDATGNLVDSTRSPADITALEEQSEDLTSGKIWKVPYAVEGNLPRLAADGGLTDSGIATTNVATKVVNAVVGSFAGLDASGNLTNSGKAPADIDNIEAKAVMSRGTHNQSTIPDFDDVLEPGVYRISNYTDIQNMPEQSVGTLIVFTPDISATTHGIVQVYFVGDSFWSRIRWSGDWDAWRNNVPAIPNANKRLSTSENFTAPYDDLDTFPSGIYTASISWRNAAHCPEKINTGTLLVFSDNSRNDAAVGRVQMLIGAYSYAGKIAWRINWGATPTWSDWFYLEDSTGAVTARGTHDQSTIPDFDDVLEPGVYKIDDYTDIQNMPSQSVGVLVVMTGDTSASSSDGVVQIFYAGSRQWMRWRWGGAWSSWQADAPAIPNVNGYFSDPSQFVAPYDDFDTFPVGVYTSATSWSSVANYPEDIPYGTMLMYSYNSGDSSAIGRVQIMVGGGQSAGKMAWRINWGATLTWTDWTYAVVDSKTMVSRGSFTVSTLPDFDTILTPGSYVITNFTNIQNMPVQNVGTLEVSVGDTSNTAKGVVQTFTAGTRRWWRQRWSSSWSNWLESNSAIPDRGIMLNADSLATAPYNDFDTFPVGVYTSSSSWFVSENHPPNISLGTLIVYSCNASNASTLGRTQLMIGVNGQMAWRINWYDSSTWTDWQTLDPSVTPAIPNRNGYFSDSSQFVAPYDDFDTFPVGIYTSSVSWSNVANYPEDVPYGTMLMYSYNYENDSAIGRVQIMIGTNGRMAWRLNWYNSSTWTEWQTIDPSYIKDAAEKQYGSIGLFESFGVVGDSYASGEIYIDGHGHDYYELSWGQIIAKRNGITCTNFTKGGLTTRTWLTHEKGQALLLSESAKKLYLLVLGINDVGKLGTSYIGSSADIAESYTNNADTFWGNYSRIISIIKEHAPNAKIIMFKMASNSGAYATFNAAIEGIADYWDIPVVAQTDDAFFTSAFYTDNMVGGHPTGVMYSGMALAFERLIAKCFVYNPGYFADYVG